MSEEDLLNKHVVIVANLEPTKLRGELSEGMLLAAEDEDKHVELIVCDDAKPGTKIITSETSHPKRTISFKEFLEVKFEVKNKKILANNLELTAEGKKLKVKSIKNGIIR